MQLRTTSVDPYDLPANISMQDLENLAHAAEALCLRQRRTNAVVAELQHVSNGLSNRLDAAQEFRNSLALVFRQKPGRLREFLSKARELQLSIDRQPREVERRIKLASEDQEVYQSLVLGILGHQWRGELSALF
jgi:hypothetical protein